MSNSNKNNFIEKFDSSNIKINRLYKIELRKSEPDACAPFAILLYDIQDRTMDQIFSEIESYLVGQSGKWEIFIYYWSGEMRCPSVSRRIGRDKDFVYNDNPRGDIVLKLDMPIEIDLG